MLQSIKIIMQLAVVLVLASCSGIRTMPEGEKIYTGATVEVESAEKLKNERDIKNRVKGALRPKPNTKFLGNRPKVWIYNITDDTTAKGFTRWLHNKIGEPPVTMKDVNPQSTVEIINAVLFNMGIFNASTTYEMVEAEKKGSLIYRINAHTPYTISGLRYQIDSGEIKNAVEKLSGKSIIKAGRNYELNMLIAERKRIDDGLKNQGYFYFREDYILFKADTSVSGRTVALTMSLKEDIPPEHLQVYRIGQVSVESDYSLGARDTSVKDSAVHQGVIFSGVSAIRPKVILRSVFLKEQEIYSRKNHNITLSRLMGMGTFKFVRINFNPSLDRPLFLDPRIHLTPAPRQSIQAELQTISKSNNFLGPALTLAFQNRNTFHGAEILKLNLKGSLETQITGNRSQTSTSNVFSYEVGPELEYIIPRFLTPFRIRQKKSIYIPRTKLSTSFDFLSRVNYYDLSSFKLQFGYLWKENIKISHELHPVVINYFSVRNKSEAFEKLLNENPFFRRSFDNQFIAGINYTYNFNEQVIPNQSSQFFLLFTTDFAGNTLSAYHKIFLNETPDPDTPLTVGGIPYSQFMRFTIDIRNYFNLDARNKIVVRVYTGMGYPYGNSSTLPYVKQFFSGGPNSVRAFRINALGPGITPPDSISNSILRNGGDLKLEANAEYRFDIYQIVKGALFVDAGNMWIQEEDSLNPYSGFERSKLLGQLAVGAGFGLRFDASFFVLRFDLAFPVRKPWLESGKRWVFTQSKNGQSEKKSSNLILNIAIGYPF